MQDYKLPEEFKQKWIAALKSGEYTQGRGLLCNTDESGKKMYCCLGVAVAMAGGNPGEFGFIQPGVDGINLVPTILIGKGELPDKLAVMNDGGKSFEEIAEYISENL